MPREAEIFLKSWCCVVENGSFEISEDREIDPELSDFDWFRAQNPNWADQGLSSYGLNN